jgi:hypothetical protein
MTMATVKTIEEDFHWHWKSCCNSTDRFERASWFFHNPVPLETAARRLSR